MVQPGDEDGRKLWPEISAVIPVFDLALNGCSSRLSRTLPKVFQRTSVMTNWLSGLRPVLGMAAAGLLVWAIPANPANADSAFIGGMKLSCRAAKVVVSDAVPGPGFAVQGMIMFGPKFLRAYPPLVQRLVFLHECGHQYVGTDEGAADCWAVQSGKRQGWLKPAGLAQACKALWHTQSDGVHLAGPERCQALQQCYDTAPSKGH